MGAITIRYPKTGHSISIGMKTDQTTFEGGFVFYGRSFFPIYRTRFARDAWVSEPDQDSRLIRSLVDLASIHKKHSIGPQAGASMVPSQRVPVARLAAR